MSGKGKGGDKPKLTKKPTTLGAPPPVTDLLTPTPAAAAGPSRTTSAVSVQEPTEHFVDVLTGYNTPPRRPVADAPADDSDDESVISGAGSDAEGDPGERAEGDREFDPLQLDQTKDVLAPDAKGRPFLYGCADIPEFYEKWLAVDKAYKGLMMRKFGYGILKTPWNDPEVVTMVAIATTGRDFLLNGDGSALQPDRIYTVTMAELLAPVLPRELFLTRPAAQATFIASIKRLLLSPRMASITDATVNDYVAELNRERAQPLTDQEIQEVKQLWEDPQVPLTLEVAYKICAVLAMHAKRSWRLGGLSLLAHVYVSVLKRGNTTQRFLRKVSHGIEADVGTSIDFREDSLRLFYAHFGTYITSRNIATIIKHWENMLPAHALRLTLTCQQAANGGLTGIVCVGRAIIKHQGFHWSRVKGIFPDEWANFVAAVLDLEGNIWRGFDRSLGPIRSTLYKPLIYIAVNLLVKVSGEGSLLSYAGAPAIVPNQAAVDRLIADYERDRANYILGAEGAAAPVDPGRYIINDLITVLESYPQLYSQ